MPRQSDGELTIVFGPPAEPSLRQHFDAYQAAVQEKREDEANRYEALEKELFEEIFQGNGEEDSIFDELLSGALETKVRVRRFDFGRSIMRGLFVPTVVIHARDLEFLRGTRVVRFPPEAETRNALAAALGHALEREWFSRCLSDPHFSAKVHPNFRRFGDGGLSRKGNVKCHGRGPGARWTRKDTTP